MKKISVIIPVYNAQHYLEECLESVLRQTFRDFEVILMNDGSTDGSQKIIERYTAEYPDIFRGYCQKNQGQSAARNHALKYSGGGILHLLMQMTISFRIIWRHYIRRRSAGILSWLFAATKSF